MKKILLSILFVLFTGLVSGGEFWPPVLEKTEPYNNRVTDWYKHGVRAEWNCLDKNQTDIFTVMHPMTGDGPDLPLYVVLHSAGHDVHSCMNCTKTVGNHDIYHAPNGFYALYVDCKAHQSTDWWWGGLRAEEKVNPSNKAKAGTDLQPVEKRVLDTVKWVIEKYKIDANRVYLCGNSMGGSGTLGLGIPHGDIFAAIKANVPAGVLHAASRLQFPDASPAAGVKIPDPPVCIDYSAPNDRWSTEHEILFAGMKLRKYPIIAYWGNFGHANNSKTIEKTNDLINTFDWTEIRRNAAYPVFTNASCDDALPWPDREKAVKPGQVNAFFRWKNLSDTADKMEMELFIDGNIKTTIFTVPKEATGDVSFRRLQNFQVKPGETIRWSFAGKSGTVQADAVGLVTLTGLHVTQNIDKVILTK